MMPKTFTARVTILPPEKEDRTGLSTLLKSSQDITITPLQANLQSEVFVDILNSRTVAESLIAKYNLKQVFDIDSTQDGVYAVTPLKNATEITNSRTGLVSVEVALRTGYFAGAEEENNIRQLVSDVANGYVEQLDKIHREKLVSRARSSRIYIEEQIVKTKADLDSTYKRLQDFQEKHKAVSLDEQVNVAIKSAAEIKAQIIAAEIQRDALLKNATSDNIQIQELQTRIEQLKKQYQNLQYGGRLDSGEFYVPFSEVPAVARELANLIRETKIQEEVYKFLQQQYYKERVQEARDTPTVQVLDPAKPPLERSAPRRALLVSIAAIVGFIIGAFLAFFRNYIAKAKTATNGSQKILELASDIKSDYMLVKLRILNLKKRIAERKRTR
jgi:uncharacterized protein involved in exopolysaccharide biosynthesis